MKTFGGKVLFIDRSDVNTDEIIPAKYLTEISKEALKPHLLEDLKCEGFDPVSDVSGKQVIVARDNFGCGSSREHAPWALEVNGIHTVFAVSFARIFRQNMYNCGMPAIELPPTVIDELFDLFSSTTAVSGSGSSTETTAAIDIEKNKVSFSNSAQSKTASFELKGFDLALIKAGGWVEYADKHY